MDTVAPTADNRRTWTIVSDDNCPVVRFLSRLVKSCDSHEFFRFVGKENNDEHSRKLFRELSASPWSLLLIDDHGQRLQGPEAIPFILKNLPSGRLACVAYLIPGTMWLTQQLYLSVSRNRKQLAKLRVSSSQQTEPGQAA
ncbi:MAG: DCC1-like thiol-disulfide oxidoreductase family protein [Candidatus Obscuribacterales bacterium]|nr:DCC1-like thiol-disulfide oxidoreductase family protein [Candidatus Obscuribacterales bacterium]